MENNFKENDILYVKTYGGFEAIFIYSKYKIMDKYYKTSFLYSYSISSITDNALYENPGYVTTDKNIVELRKATYKEKCLLFNKIFLKTNNPLYLAFKNNFCDNIKNENYLPKFGEKILVNCDENGWTGEIFSHFSDNKIYKVVSFGRCNYATCIPYEGNEDLVGTNNEPHIKYDI